MLSKLRRWSVIRSLVVFGFIMIGVALSTAYRYQAFYEDPYAYFPALSDSGIALIGLITGILALLTALVGLISNIVDLMKKRSKSDD